MSYTLVLAPPVVAVATEMWKMRKRKKKMGRICTLPRGG